MEHPHIRIGRLMLSNPPADLEPYRLDGAAMTVLAPSAGMQRRHKVLNASLQFQRWSALEANAGGSARAASRIDRLRRERSVPRGAVAGALYLRGEQAPNPDSRISLVGLRDRLGMPRVRLDWQLGRLDIEGHVRTARHLGAELGAAALGRVKLELDAAGGAPILGGAHHIGTTRMARRPRNGVVDRDGRVFGVDNLFVAGSSVFPTSGFANPTFMIVALTLRLADHLERLLGGPRRLPGAVAEGR